MVKVPWSEYIGDGGVRRDRGPVRYMRASIRAPAATLASLPTNTLTSYRHRRDLEKNLIWTKCAPLWWYVWCIEFWNQRRHPIIFLFHAVRIIRSLQIYFFLRDNRMCVLRFDFRVNATCCTLWLWNICARQMGTLKWIYFDAITRKSCEFCFLSFHEEGSEKC